jgi:hypothetical protein
MKTRTSFKRGDKRAQSAGGLAKAAASRKRTEARDSYIAHRYLDLCLHPLHYVERVVIERVRPILNPEARRRGEPLQFGEWKDVATRVREPADKADTRARDRSAARIISLELRERGVEISERQVRSIIKRLVPEG